MSLGNLTSANSRVATHAKVASPPWQIEDRGLVYDATDAPAHERVACFTSLVRLQSDTLLACFQVGPIKHSSTSTIGICRSTDGGKSWRRLPLQWETSWQGVPGSLSIAEMVECEPGRLLLVATWFDRSDPARPLFDPVTEGLLPSRQLKAFSNDEGATWTSWQELPTDGLTGCALTGPILKWSDESLAVAFESFKHYDDPRPARHGAWLLTSEDQGRTFGKPVLVARCPLGDLFYWDQRLCAGSQPGEFFGLFWTHDRSQQKDLPVHAGRGTLVDGDLAKIELRDTEIPGQIAASALLSNDLTVAFAVDRGRPATMTLWTSFDGGETWPAKNAMIVYEHDERAQGLQGTKDIDFKKYWDDFAKWSFGHPSLRELADGSLLLVYYAGTPDRMNVHWARLRSLIARQRAE